MNAGIGLGGLSLRFVVAGAAGLCVSVGNAGADVEYAFYVNSGIWGFDFSHMPDLDQVRDGLPGDGGMYCVPTASMNLFAYVANHGFPAVFPGPGCWQASSGPAYDEMTDNLALLGAVMGTSSVNGTNGEGWQIGMSVVLGPSGKFNVINKWAGGNSVPRVREMAQHVAMGGIVACAYGRYEVLGTIDGVPLVDRQGGHAVTMQKALANSGVSGVMWYRDPADGGSAFTQSQYGSREMSFEQQAVRLDWQPLTVLNLDRMVITPAPDDGRLRIIDQYMAIRPKAGFAFQPASNGAQIFIANIGDLFIGQDFNLDFSNLGGPMIDGIVNTQQTGVFVLVDPDDGAPEQLFEVLPFEEEPRLIGQLLRTKHLTISPWGPVYAASNIALMCIDPDHPEPEVIQVPIPQMPCDISFDTLNRRVMLLSAEGVLMMVSDDLQGDVLEVDIPDSVPLNSSSKFSVHPGDGSVWIITPGSDSVWGLRMVVGGPVLVEEVSVAEIMRPGSVDVDDQGVIHLNTLNGLYMLIPDKDGGWTAQVNELFPDVPAGSAFMSSKNITNFDTAVHVGPRFRHLFPEEILKIGTFTPDCPGDVVANGSVDLADLNLVLANFGTSVDPGTSGDANHDGEVDLADLNMVLANFGVECDL